MGDNSFSAFTSPVQGERYRVQYTVTTGSVTYQTALGRLSAVLLPATVHRSPFRGMSIGRYGSGAEDPNTTWPIYLGEETLIRGYGYGSFSSDECVVEQRDAANAATVGCPAFDRLFGSKVVVANAEFRIPLFGTEGFGLINFPFLPTEVSPFFDAGVAYTNAQGPDFRLASSDNNVPTSVSEHERPAQRDAAGVLSVRDRIPVFSTGVSFRFNLMGYAIMEAYLAHPFQRPQKNWVWGFQLAPGW